MARFQWFFKYPSKRGVRLDAVLDCEWIHRSWTFQEFALATNPVILCGNQTISWDMFASAIRSRPWASKLKVDDVVPASPVVLSHWRSVMDLWFNLPRPQPRKSKSTDANVPGQISYRNNIITLWEERGKLPLSFRSFQIFTATFLQILMLGLWGSISFIYFTRLMRHSKKEYWFILWLVLAVAVFIIGAKMHSRFRFIFFGWNQHWLLQHQMESEDHRLLDAIQAALRERKSSEARDKSYALYGILRVHSASLSAPDYSHSVGETYRKLVLDLVHWNPTAIAVIMDASSRSRATFDGPTWVPNWQTSVPSSWLTSNCLLGVTESCTRLIGKPSVRISGSRLHLRGTHNGTVIFKTQIPRINFNDTYEERNSSLHSVLMWIAYLRQKVPATSPNGSPLSFLFVILDGFSPKRGPLTEHVGYRADLRSVLGGFGTIPPFEGPHDFTSRKKDFKNWAELHSILESFLALKISTRPVFSKLIKTVKASETAYQYLTRLHKKLSEDSRGFFVLDTGFVGTGPPEVEVGDVAYLLDGIPVPMLLRQKAGDSTLSVVGAAMVHGVMHGEGFYREDLRDVVLV